MDILHVTARRSQDGLLVLGLVQLHLVVALAHRFLGPAGLVAFGFTDDHVHFLFIGDRAAVGEAVRCFEASLTRRLGAPPFERARIRPVTSRRHLVNTIRYVLFQVEQHELLSDPNHVGSSLHELLGLRVDPSGLCARVLAAAPRRAIEEYARQLPWGLDALEGWDEPLTRDELVALKAAMLHAWASVLPAARNPREPKNAARLSAVLAAEGWPTSPVARALEVDPSTVRRLRRQLRAASSDELRACWGHARCVRRAARLVLWTPPERVEEGVELPVLAD